MIFVDGVDIGDVADVALRDRRMLSGDGIFIIVATVSEQDGSSVVAPEVLARGVPFLDGNGAFIDELREAVEDSLDRAAEQQITEIDVLESLPARRPRGVHLRPAQAPPDGAAGRRRGLSPGRFSARRSMRQPSVVRTSVARVSSTAEWGATKVARARSGPSMSTSISSRSPIASSTSWRTAPGSDASR